MNITVIGTGYVGLVVGACLAETGNPVICADVDQEKIDGLKQNVLPIYEPGLDDYVERNQSQGRLVFTTDVASAIGSADVVFIAVGTPPDEDGSADLRHVLAVAEQIGRHMRRELVVVTKSTVPVGTAAKVAAAVSRNATLPYHMCSNPEFLKARGTGTAVYYPLPLHLQPCFAYLGYREGQCPESERAAHEVLSLPIFPELTRSQIDEVIAAVRAFFGA